MVAVNLEKKGILPKQWEGLHSRGGNEAESSTSGLGFTRWKGGESEMNKIQKGPPRVVLKLGVEPFDLSTEFMKGTNGRSGWEGKL